MVRKALGVCCFLAIGGCIGDQPQEAPVAVQRNPLVEPCADFENLFPLVGPITYPREAGMPSPATEDFHLEVSGTACVRILAEHAPGSRVDLDGEPLFAESYFAPARPPVQTRSLELASGEHTLTTLMRGGPGNSITLEVRMLVPPDPCASAAVNGVELLPPQQFVAGFGESVAERVLDVPEPGRLCLQATLAPELSSARASFAVDGHPIGEIVEFGPDIQVFNASLPIPRNSPHTLTVTPLDGAMTVRVLFVPSDFGIETGNADPPPCEGRLLGFEEPPGSGTGRRAIERRTRITCTLTYNGPPIFVDTVDRFGNERPDFFLSRTSVSKTAASDDSGRFTVRLRGSDLDAARVHPDAALVEAVATCASSLGCGHEVDPAEVAGRIELLSEMNIVDVLDVSVLGIGARLISSHPNDPARINDLPVIVHEGIDTANLNGTNFTVWVLGGQATDTTPLAEDGTPLPDLDPAALNVCSPRVGPCVPYRPGCSPADCLVPGSPIVCTGANVLGSLRAAGYDVWIIDHLIGDADLTHTAGQSPIVYQYILDYPVPDPERRVAVSGISLGGVVARLALKLWEKKAAVQSVGGMPGVVDANGVAVPLVELPPEFVLDPGPDRVALFASIDSPHLGARVPIALQAYLRDPLIPGTAAFRSELNTTPTAQLLQESRSSDLFLSCLRTYDPNDPPKGEELAEFLQNCRIDSDITPSLTTTEPFEAFIASAIDAVDPAVEDPLGRPPDGLPDLIPSIALSNGELVADSTFTCPSPAAHDVGTDEVLQVRIDTEDDIYRHRIFDDQCQPRGSQQNGMCEAGSVGFTFARLNPVEAFIAHCQNSPLTVLLPKIDVVPCVVVGALASGVKALVGLAEGKILGVNVDVTMRPEATATNSAFPTFIPTDSALLARSGGVSFPSTWTALLWQDRSRFHSHVDNRSCSFVRTYLDAYMLGDRDGYVSCEHFVVGGMCRLGGRELGNLFDAAEVAAHPERFCDCCELGTESSLGCSPATAPAIHPGAIDLAGDGVDSNCDGIDG